MQSRIHQRYLCRGNPGNVVKLTNVQSVRVANTNAVNSTSLPQPSVDSVKKDPFAEKTQYRDNPLEKFLIGGCTQRVAAQMEGVTVPENSDYNDLVRVSKELMKGRNPSQQRDLVLKALRTILPEFVSLMFRKLFPPNQLSAELNAAIASKGFGWLVGETELKSADVEVAPGEVRRQTSVVYIKKCRFLESGGCVGMCVNICKVPTQQFFKDDFGLPLTMKPNFEDLSCEMIFGQAPPAVEKDLAFSEPCFATSCSMASDKKTPPCRTLDPQSYSS
jgi:hypothetical protein